MSKSDNKQIRLLLILGNFYDPKMPSWPEVMGIFGVNFQKLGHEVYWLMPYSAKVTSKILEEKFMDTKIYLVPQLKTRNPLLYILSLAIYLFRVYRISSKIIKEKNINSILVRDDAWAGLIAVVLKKFFKVPVFFNYSFPVYQGVLDSFNYNKSIFNFLRLIYWKIWESIVFFVFRSCSAIFPISQEMAEEIRKRGVKKELIPLPLGVEPAIFKITKSREEIRKLLKINDEDVVFVYVGSISKLRGLSVLLEAFATLREKRAKLIFVGEGDDLKNLKKLANELGIHDNVLFTGRVPYEAVPNYINASDVGVSIIRPLKCYHVASPCKLFEYMLIGKPVLANIEIPEHLMVVNSANCGVLTKYEKNEIADSIEALIKVGKEHKEILEQMGIKGKEWVLKNRTFEILAKKVITTIVKYIN